MTDIESRFKQLGLAPEVLKAIDDLGYETPSPIQSAAIPIILKGQDLIGQAQTGTGKTGAFALPILTNIKAKSKVTQVLILTPTRELAIQVAEACQSYAKYLDGFHVLPIYGGQSYDNQLRQLKRGAQIVVGTPGRVMDHMRRKTLSLDQLTTLVLDEADEMLRMGFIDDVKWVLEHTPPNRQIALFSATMPTEIKKVAETYLNNPSIIKIAEKTASAKTITQRYLLTSGINKLDALTRIFEVEDFDGIIVFVRTKLATEELASKLSARGFSSAALNGDIPQAVREKTVERLKNGQIDILVATDVAARGLDVERISHVVNYEVPYDTEAYIHRIGRTGRAGRSGQAILFIAPREKRMLLSIEKACGQKIEQMAIPSASDINEKRVDQFKQNILQCLDNEDLTVYQEIIEVLAAENDLDPLRIAAALAHICQGNRSFLLNTKGDEKITRIEENFEKFEKKDQKTKKDMSNGAIRPLKDHPEIKLARYRVDIGRQDGVKPGNLVGAIANTADINSEYIGQIEIYDNFSTIDLPEGIPKAILKLLESTRVANRPLALRPVSMLSTKDPDSDQKKPRRRTEHKVESKARKKSSHADK